MQLSLGRGMGVSVGMGTALGSVYYTANGDHKNNHVMNSICSNKGVLLLAGGIAVFALT